MLNIPCGFNQACRSQRHQYLSTKSLFYLTPFQFQSTMIVPALSTGSGYHAVWPGLENASDGFVYQNIVSDSNGAGQWEFWVEYCCECV
jgi:hypothetical protein